MEPEFFQAFPENRDFITFVIENLQDPANRDYLQLLLTEDDAWEEFMAAAVLSRYEGDVLRRALEQLSAYAATEDAEGLHTDLQARSQFLDAFPCVEMELVEQIGKLRELAARVEQVHRNCAISRMVASSCSVASGVLSILGLALAPVTLGGSATLCSLGLGLGAVATLTGAASSLVGGVRKWSVEAEATQLLSTSVNQAKIVAELCAKTTASVAALRRMYLHHLPRLGKNIQAMRLVKAKPSLAASAKVLMTTGKISARKTKQVQKAFGDTVLAMTKGARVKGAATAGAFLLWDVIDLVEEMKCLHQGAKTESAEELRRHALQLERRLEELIRAQDCWLSDVTWQYRF